MPVPTAFTGRLSVPLIAAPMTTVSTVALVVACCQNGVIGAFPTHNATEVELPTWLDAIRSRLAARELGQGRACAPWAANVVVHRSNRRRDRDIAALIEFGVELVITSVGSPLPVIDRLHDAGCLVFADVATLEQAARALDAGVDGLILLSAGAGGQTGWINPLAFLRAMRSSYEGPLVLAGGIADGAALAAATVAGADLGYMGTRFIATTESGATEEYRTAVVAAGPQDILTTTALTGLPANVLAASPELPNPDAELPTGFEQEVLLRYRQAWAAGHSVSGTLRPSDAATLIRELSSEYQMALLSTTSR